MSMNVGWACQTGQMGQGSQVDKQSGGLAALLQGLFAKVDTDGNGSINAGEFGDLMGQASGGSAGTDTSDLFKSIDKDGDGQISLAEFKQFAGNLFADKVSASSGGQGHYDQKSDGELAADIYKKIAGNGLPPGSTLSVSVFHITYGTDGAHMDGVTVSGTTAADGTSSMISGNGDAPLGSLVRLSNALSSYGNHRKHGTDGLAQLFNKLDSDGDGSISGAEFASALQAANATDVTASATAGSGITVG
ncbi:MAG TPA: EF-hand domain-containing protein [Alphaproteobacteria bacterium]|nr:EF-hand domain-containing protein [Alphaproteobacteria bacterium]